MARRGLIRADRVEAGFGYALLPFVVGIYEMQVDRLDAEFARLFEDYYQQAFGHALAFKPAVHRVIPVGESVRLDMQIHPYESVAEILDAAKAWGVLDCICRKQKALIGEPCEHPVDVCMILSTKPGAFDQSPVVKALTREQAQDTLRRAARAGLVHSVSNHKGLDGDQSSFEYICNCCTCSCGVLRGIAEMGISNAVARSAFINQVDEASCSGCEVCLAACQFEALTVDEVAHVSELRCVGCGVCVSTCPDGALVLVRRPQEQQEIPPANYQEWLEQRASSRGLDLEVVL
jgi:Fe-S-cluster-containing hydrogenase component 2